LIPQRSIGAKQRPGRMQAAHVNLARVGTSQRTVPRDTAGSGRMRPGPGRGGRIRPLIADTLRTEKPTAKVLLRCVRKESRHQPEDRRGRESDRAATTWPGHVPGKAFGTLLASLPDSRETLRLGGTRGTTRPLFVRSGGPCAKGRVWDGSS